MVLGPEDPATAMTVSGLAILYGDMGNYTKAEPLFLRALEISDKRLGSTSSQNRACCE